MAKITFRVPSADLEREVQRALKNVGSRTRMKGFRPGKVPVQVLEKSFGREVRRETVQRYVREAYEKAVKDEELRPAAHPEITEEQLDVLVGSDLEVEFDLCLRPELEIGDTTGLEVRVPKVEVDDEELERALEDVRVRQSSAVKAEDGEGLEESGMALGKMTFLLGEEELNERDGMRVSPQQAPPGADPGAWKEALVGAGVGDTVEVPVVYPEEFPEERARGETGTCRIAVAEVYRVVPPTDEQLFAMFEAEDEAGMRENARERILEAKREQRDQLVEAQLMEQMLSTHPMELPTQLVERQVAARLQQLEQELANEGVSPEEAEERLQAESDSAYESASKALSALYLVEAIGQKEGLKITDEDMRAELQEIARRNNAPVDTVQDYYREQNLFPQLATELLEKKVRAFLRENASITEE